MARHPNVRTAEYQARRAAKRALLPKIPCACGCGTMIPERDVFWKPARYAVGHNGGGNAARTRFQPGHQTWNKGKPHPRASEFHKGRKHSRESVERMIATRTARGTWPPRAWNKGLPHPTKGIQQVSSSAVGGYRADIGFYVRSRWEANFARYLRLIGKSFSYEPECFIVTLDDGTQHAYRPDFLVENSMYIEVKGWENRGDRPTTKILDAAKRQLPRPLAILRRAQYAALKAKHAHRIPKWEHEHDPKPGFIRPPCRTCNGKMSGKPIAQIYCSTKCTPRPFTGRTHSAESIAKRTATRLAKNGGSYFAK